MEKRIRFQPFTHVTCKTPVVFGGLQTDLENLEVVDSASNMTFLGQIVSQTKDLPPGTRIDRIRTRSD
jgi:hypothetical protein